MSLRARLALVLAGVLLGPLLAATVAVGVLVPRAEAAESTAAVRRGATGAAAALSDQCLALGEVARAVALELSAGLASGRRLDPVAAVTAAEHAVSRREGTTALVLGAAEGLPAGAGPLRAGVAPAALPALSSVSCARGSIADAQVQGIPGPDGGTAATPLLVESVPVVGSDGREVARALALTALDDAALRRLVARLGLAARLAIVEAGDRPRLGAATDAPGPRGSAVLVAAGPGREGLDDGLRWAAAPAPAGGPWTVVAWRPAGGSALVRTLAVVTAVAMLLGVGALVVLTRRLTGPLVTLAGTARRLGRGDLSARSGLGGRDEVGVLASAFDAMAADLERTVDELRSSRDVLGATFARFGEALARTHDVDGLLETVVEAARAGARATTGTVVLVAGGNLTDGLSCGPDGEPPATPVLDVLGVLSREAVLTASQVVRTEALPAGPALAVPLLRGERVVGALAVARRRGEAPFSPEDVAAVAALGASAGTAVGNVREHEETRRLSVTDPLTGIGNFRQLSTTLSREVERATRFRRPLSVLMLDLDHFKQVNDTLGHAFGDVVLRECAARLQDCLREVDTVARYGGEEFAVVLPETALEGATAVAARIVAAVRAAPFTAGDRERRVTVSVGVAAFPDHGRTATDVMRAADDALYRAKQAGRDRWSRAGEPTVDETRDETADEAPDETPDETPGERADPAPRAGDQDPTGEGRVRPDGHGAAARAQAEARAR